MVDSATVVRAWMDYVCETEQYPCSTNKTERIKSVACKSVLPHSHRHNDINDSALLPVASVILPVSIRSNITLRCCTDGGFGIWGHF